MNKPQETHKLRRAKVKKTRRDRCRSSLRKDVRSLDIQDSTSNRLIEGFGRGSRSFSPGQWECRDVLIGYDPEKDAIVGIKIEDKSIQNRQHLKLFKPKVLEVMELRGRQLLKDEKGNPVFDKDGKPVLVEVSNQRVKLSDRTLLIQGKPTIPVDKLKLKRRGSRSKIARFDEDIDFTREVKQTSATDDVTDDPDYNPAA